MPSKPAAADLESSAQPVASQRVADILAERILSGRLKPGARIKQDDLAEELSTSRIPVRDALRILETRGLVTLRANAGARVSSMTPRDLELSYEIRERIEPLLLSDSLPHLTEADLAEMRRLHAEMETDRDVERFLELDRRFHWTCYRRHRAPHLAQMVERLWDTTQSYRHAYFKTVGTDDTGTTNAEHRLLLEAAERRDTETAAAALVLQIRRVRIALRTRRHLLSDAPA